MWPLGGAASIPCVIERSTFAGNAMQCNAMQWKTKKQRTNVADGAADKQEKPAVMDCQCCWGGLTSDYRHKFKS